MVVFSYPKTVITIAIMGIFSRNKSVRNFFSVIYLRLNVILKSQKARTATLLEANAC